MYETSKFNPNIGKNNMPKHNNNLVWNDKMWEDAWDKRFYDEYVNNTKNDLKQIKQTLFQMQSLINLIENDINKMEDKNNAIS